MLAVIAINWCVFEPNQYHPMPWQCPFYDHRKVKLPERTIKIRDKRIVVTNTAKNIVVVLDSQLYMQSQINSIIWNLKSIVYVDHITMYLHFFRVLAKSSPFLHLSRPPLPHIF